RDTHLDIGIAHGGRRNVRAEAVDGDDAEREADLPTKVGCAEDPRDSAKQETASQEWTVTAGERTPSTRLTERGRELLAPGLPGIRRPQTSYLIEPPAASIFALAEADTLSTSTFS